MKKGLEIAPNNPEIWYNLGGAYFTMKEYPKAMEAWEKTLQLKPSHQQAQQGYAAIKAMMASQPVKK